MPRQSYFTLPETFRDDLVQRGVQANVVEA